MLIAVEKNPLYDHNNQNVCVHMCVCVCVSVRAHKHLFECRFFIMIVWMYLCASVLPNSIFIQAYDTFC